MVDPTGQLRFFIRAAMGPAGRPHFFDALVSPAIGGAVLTEVDIAIVFFRLSL